MKIIISETRVSKLIANYIEMTYGELNQIYEEGSDGYLWIREGEILDEVHPLFSMSSSGTLFVPYSFSRTIGDLFGFEYKREVDKAIADCWRYMFGLRPERINIYFD